MAENKFVAPRFENEYEEIVWLKEKLNGCIEKLRNQRQEKENLTKYLEKRIYSLQGDTNGVFASSIYYSLQTYKELLEKVKSGKYE